MARRRAQPPTPFWTRVEAVMRVQLGQATVEEASRGLGLSRMQYYRLEEAMLRAALEAVTPKKRGRKPRAADPKIAVLETALRQKERQRELAELKAKELERIAAEMRRRGIGTEGGKKRRRVRRPRKALPGSVSPADAGLGGTRSPGEEHRGSV